MREKGGCSTRGRGWGRRDGAAAGAGAGTGQGMGGGRLTAESPIVQEHMIRSRISAAICPDAGELSVSGVASAT